MKNVTIRYAQLTILDALIAIHTICEKHNIQYWLDSGTLLGAVRHEGFISWDDDIDVCMLRHDFERFLLIAPNELNQSLYFLQTPASDPSYKEYNIPCKLRVNDTEILETNKFLKPIFFEHVHKGFFVDILPCDRYPKNKLKRKLLQRFYLLFSAKSLFYFNKISVKKFIISRFVHYFFPITLLDKVKNILIARTNSNRKNKIISKGIELPFHKGNIPEEKIFPLQLIKFEKHYFYAPKDVNYYLTSLYGENYIVPPDKNKRVSHYSSLKAKA